MTRPLARTACVDRTLPASRTARTPTLLTAALLALALAPSLAGCFASQTQLRAVDDRLAAIERAEQTRAQSLERARQQVDALNEQLAQARTQTRNLADLGARLDGIDEQLRAASGGIAEVRRAVEQGAGEEATQRTQLAQQLGAIERRLLELERRAGVAPAVDASQIPESPADTLAQAQQAFTQQNYARARALANAVLTRTPQDVNADDARLLLGRILLQENRAAMATQEFQRVVTDYPSGDALPEALSQMSEAFIRLGWCTQARRTLQILIDRHGTTTQGRGARTRLEQVRRLPRAACTQ